MFDIPICSIMMALILLSILTSFTKSKVGIMVSKKYIIAFFIVLTLWASGFAAKKQQAPNFSLKDINGKEVSLSSFRGKIVVLNFWATWCAPCLRDMPSLESFHKKYGDDVQVLGIAVVSKSSDIPKQIKRTGITYPVLLGTKKTIAAYNNFYSIPQTFIINRSGEIEKQIDGSFDLNQLEKELKILLNP